MNTDNNSETKPSLTIFLDRIGRLILGEKTESTDDSFLNIKNPVVIMINGDQTGKMSVQLFPLFFKEFLADKNSEVVLNYKKETITLTNIDALDFRLQTQYTQMFNNNNSFVAPQPEQQNNGGVINLFAE